MNFQKQQSSFFLRFRTISVKIFFGLLGLATLAKLFQIQLLDHKKYIALAKDQHWYQQKINARRGKIITSDGYALVTNEEAYDFYLDLKEFRKGSDCLETQDPCLATPEKIEERTQKLVRILRESALWSKKGPSQDSADKEEEELKARINQTNYSWILVAKQIPADLKEIIETEILGSSFQRHDRRRYPEGSLGAHFIGFVGTNTAGEDQGYFGLEGFYNGDLTREKGWLSLEKDALGNPLPIGNYRTLSPQHGRSLVLTINRELQYLLERKLYAGVERYGAKSGTFILLSPESGAVLAMGNYPTFQPSDWRYLFDQEGSEDDPGPDRLVNQAVAESYEPGSVLKVIVMSAALEERVVEPQSSFSCDGPYSVQGHQIKTWNNRYHGEETMAEILQHSCNVGAAWLSNQLGMEKYLQYVDKYGLGEKTAIDLEGETAGIVKDPQTWRPIDLATASFGQGISVSPIQLATVFNTIANRGVKTQPYIVKEILDEQDQVEIASPRPFRVLSIATAEKLQSMLRDVVDKGEFNWFVEQAGLDNFPLAGKTGTAQIPRGGGYDPNKTNVTFAGFAPATQPQFTLLVRLQEPSTSTYSAETAVPLWLEMAKELIYYWGIAPRS